LTVLSRCFIILTSPEQFGGKERGMTETIERNVLIVTKDQGLRQNLETVIRRGNGVNWRRADTERQFVCQPHYADSMISAMSFLRRRLDLDLIMIECDLRHPGDLEGVRLYSEIQDSGCDPPLVLLRPAAGNAIEIFEVKGGRDQKLVADETALADAVHRIIAETFERRSSRSRPTDCRNDSDYPP
jgi:hypothetical protein